MEQATFDNLVVKPYMFVNYRGDSVEAELGTFQVIENRRKGDSSKKIELAYVRFPSTSSSPGNPIVYLAGGPGGSGIDAARGARFALFMSLREIGDVIAFDQRATGLSSPMEFEECEVEMPRPGGIPLSHEELEEKYLQAVKECGEYWRTKGIDLEAYNTLESAADLESLRKVLGTKKLNILSISYGTHLAFSYLRNYPENVEMAVFAGTEGPDHTVKLPSYTEVQLNRLIALLESNHNEYPNFREYVKQTLKSVEENPVTIEYIKFGEDIGEKVVVGRPELERMSISMLKDPSTMVRLPVIYDRINAGDYLSLRTSSTLSFEMEAMEEAMDAASGMSDKRHKQFQLESMESLLGGGDILSNAKTAIAMGIPDLGDDFRASLNSSIPALFISGTLDGRTPLMNALEIAEGFDNSRHLIIKNGGHSNDLLITSQSIQLSIVNFFKGENTLDTISIDPPIFDELVAVQISNEVSDRYLGEYSDGADRLWRVVPKGTYRFYNNEGNLIQETSPIQVRIGHNGYDLEPLSESNFFVNLRGWEHVRFIFSEDSRNIMRLTYKSSTQEIGLHKVK